MHKYSVVNLRMGNTSCLPHGKRGTGQIHIRGAHRPQVTQTIPGYSTLSIILAQADKLDYVLAPGRYVGLPNDEDDFDFKERLTKLRKEFAEQLKEEEKLNALIIDNLAKVVINNGKD